ncbi:uncharacterized protein MYCFIDRAFT_180162 [Pseudocercospora fijiensis CIRAD86]|uniref:Uncharacterized protein n=1 Tax=Pseudocercospora fijiensis (strain CIRAD86) TaxID=383855 RepID=M3AIY5_PSEFD|nr:uncharacterized protein MYCFIDRAFT_180162 [Pseudocercospora fijiensis CIRAD86]EME77153.1 hypothetical protein MYCFIDRAFT_180162 [Pseudocercospora fijiensis CIRAD86]
MEFTGTAQQQKEKTGNLIKDGAQRAGRKDFICRNTTCVLVEDDNGNELCAGGEGDGDELSASREDDRGRSSGAGDSDGDEFPDTEQGSGQANGATAALQNEDFFDTLSFHNTHFAGTDHGPTPGTSQMRPLQFSSVGPPLSLYLSCLQTFASSTAAATKIQRMNCSPKAALTSLTALKQLRMQLELVLPWSAAVCFGRRSDFATYPATHPATSWGKANPQKRNAWLDPQASHDALYLPKPAAREMAGEDDPTPKALEGSKLPNRTGRHRHPSLLRSRCWALHRKGLFARRRAFTQVRQPSIPAPELQVVQDEVGEVRTIEDSTQMQHIIIAYFARWTASELASQPHRLGLRISHLCTSEAQVGVCIIRNSVRQTPERKNRWTAFSVFSGKEGWRSEGIQAGGLNSARGVHRRLLDTDEHCEGASAARERNHVMLHWGIKNDSSLPIHEALRPATCDHAKANPTRWVFASSSAYMTEKAQKAGATGIPESHGYFDYIVDGLRTTFERMKKAPVAVIPLPATNVLSYASVLLRNVPLHTPDELIADRTWATRSANHSQERDRAHLDGGAIHDMTNAAIGMQIKTQDHPHTAPINTRSPADGTGIFIANHKSTQAATNATLRRSEEEWKKRGNEKRNCAGQTRTGSIKVPDDWTEVVNGLTKDHLESGCQDGAHQHQRLGLIAPPSQLDLLRATLALLALPTSGNNHQDNPWLDSKQLCTARGDLQFWASFVHLQGSRKVRSEINKHALQPRPQRKLSEASSTISPSPTQPPMLPTKLICHHAPQAYWSFWGIGLEEIDTWSHLSGHVSCARHYIGVDVLATKARVNVIASRTTMSENTVHKRLDLAAFLWFLFKAQQTSYTIEFADVELQHNLCHLPGSPFLLAYDYAILSCLECRANLSKLFYHEQVCAGNWNLIKLKAIGSLLPEALQSAVQENLYTSNWGSDAITNNSSARVMELYLDQSEKRKCNILKLESEHDRTIIPPSKPICVSDRGQSPFLGYSGNKHQFQQTKLPSLCTKGGLGALSTGQWSRGRPRCGCRSRPLMYMPPPNLDAGGLGRVYNLTACLSMNRAEDSHVSLLPNFKREVRGWPVYIAVVFLYANKESFSCPLLSGLQRLLLHIAPLLISDSYNETG